MSLEMCVLGSGSAGNCTLVVLDGQAMLIDAGFGPRATPARLTGTGVDLADIRAILLTHADRDHFNPAWYRTLLDRRIPVYCHHRHKHAIYHAVNTSGTGRSAHLLHAAGLLREFDDQPFLLDLGAAQHPRVRPIPLAHDRNGTCGYVIENASGRLGYATDLGRVPDHFVAAMADVDILAIESNYDRAMQLASPRPPMLKHRIMGGKGHLSNDESFRAVVEVFDRSTRHPRHVVLLHLSRQCNDPRIVQRTFAGHPHIARCLHITRQDQRTEWVKLGDHPPRPRANQLSMFA